MESSQVITYGGLVALGGFLLPIWKDMRAQEHRLSSMEGELKHLRTELSKAILDADKLETKIEAKLDSVSSRLQTIEISLTQIETLLKNKII